MPDGPAKAYVNVLLEQIRIVENSLVCVVSANDMKEHTHDECKTVVGKHGRIREVSLRLFVLLVSLSLGHAVEAEAEEHHAQSQAVVSSHFCKLV